MRVNPKKSWNSSRSISPPPSASMSTNCLYPPRAGVCARRHGRRQRRRRGADRGLHKAAFVRRARTACALRRGDVERGVDLPFSAVSPACSSRGCASHPRTLRPSPCRSCSPLPPSRRLSPRGREQTQRERRACPVRRAARARGGRSSRCDRSDPITGTAPTPLRDRSARVAPHPLSQGRPTAKVAAANNNTTTPG